MRVRNVSFVLACLCALSAQAQVSVELINMPTQVYSFEPVYVLFAVENVGRSPVYLPAEGAPYHGPGVYHAPVGQTPTYHLRAIADRVYSHASSTMWLAPGERWLFYRDIGLHLGMLEGEVSVQAVMSSDGRCGGDRIEYGRHSFPLAPLLLETVTVGSHSAEVYRCWEGEARSNIWRLTVKKPTGPVDAAAHDYLIQNRGLHYTAETDTWRLQWVSGVEKKFPGSHYTYAVLVAQTSVYPKKRAVELQPENTLNPWVMGAIARHVLGSRSRCWPHGPLKFDLSIDELELPDGVRDYLEQHEWYLANRHCPRVIEEGKGHFGWPQ